jgi:hypothetical protein
LENKKEQLATSKGALNVSEKSSFKSCGLFSVSVYIAQKSQSITELDGYCLTRSADHVEEDAKGEPEESP